MTVLTYMNNLNATIALTQIKRYKENLNIRKHNYEALSHRFLLLPHDKSSSYYFATTLVENADEVIKETGLQEITPCYTKWIITELIYLIIPILSGCIANFGLATVG